MILFVVTLVVLCLFSLNYLSYSVMKEKIIGNRIWGLNISCGKTDGGGVNADIVQHDDLPNFMLVESIYNLPFSNQQFDTVLCSHTIEHVEDPERFFDELTRVGGDVTLIVPPLWDLAAVFNFWEHKWIYLTFKKEHKKLPMRIPVPFSKFYQQRVMQHIKA